MTTCPICGGTTWSMGGSDSYCPKMCGKKNQVTSGWKKIQGTKWMFRVIRKGEIVPGDGIRGWWIEEGGLQKDEDLLTYVAFPNNEECSAWCIKDKLEMMEPIIGKPLREGLDLIVLKR